MEGTRGLRRGPEAVYAAKALEPEAAPCEVFPSATSAGETKRISAPGLRRLERRAVGRLRQCWRLRYFDRRQCARLWPSRGLPV